MANFLLLSLMIIINYRHHNGTLTTFSISHFPSFPFSIFHTETETETERIANTVTNDQNRYNYMETVAIVLNVLLY